MNGWACFGVFWIEGLASSTPVFQPLVQKNQKKNGLQMCSDVGASRLGRISTVQSQVTGHSRLRLPQPLQKTKETDQVSNLWMGDAGDNQFVRIRMWNQFRSVLFLTGKWSEIRISTFPF